MFQEHWFRKYFYKKCVDVLKNEKLKNKNQTFFKKFRNKKRTKESTYYVYNIKYF